MTPAKHTFADLLKCPAARIARGEIINVLDSSVRRTNAVTPRGMRWSEIAPDLSVWTMSGARMKNGKPHDVHLSRPVQAVLCALSEARSKDSRGGKGEICDFVFSTTGKTSISGFSHDLRLTGASTLAAGASIAIDKLLAHQPTKLRRVAAIYQRYDFAEERARALDAWAERVLSNKAGQGERPLDTAMFVVAGPDRDVYQESATQIADEDVMASGAS